MPLTQEILDTYALKEECLGIPWVRTCRQHCHSPMTQCMPRFKKSWVTARLGAQAGLGAPTQEAGLRQPSKPLHHLDGIPELFRALQLGLGWVGWWQVAIAGQPVLDGRSEQVKREGRQRWAPASPPPSESLISPQLGTQGPAPAPQSYSNLQIPIPNLTFPTVRFPDPMPSHSLRGHLSQPSA